MSDEIKDNTTSVIEENNETAAPETADKGKGKGKAKETAPAAEDEDEDDEEEDDEEMEEDDDDEEDEDFSEIDPSVILTSSRRSTRATVDYASAEAAKKAGLADDIQEDDEEEEAEGEQSFMKTDDEE